jgi:hypothetical protein
LNAGVTGPNPGNVGGGPGNDVQIDNISVELDITGKFNATPPTTGFFSGLGSIYAFDPFTPVPTTELSEIISLGGLGGMVANTSATTFLRESPTKKSNGALFLNGSSVVTNSFYDVFFELSINGGQTWIAQNQESGTLFASVPEPATLALFGSGLLGLGLLRRRKAKK